MATGDTLITLTPLQYAEYAALRAKLAEAGRERDTYRATLDWLESNLTAIIRGRDSRGPSVTIQTATRQITARTITEAVMLAMEEAADADK